MATKEGGGGNASEDITTRIVERVAERENIDVMELPPLGNEVDCDALTTLVNDSPGGIDQIKFSYNGYKVVVNGSGQVETTPVKDGEDG